jgi:hypothetical protein
MPAVNESADFSAHNVPNSGRAAVDHLGCQHRINRQCLAHRMRDSRRPARLARYTFDREEN